MKHTIELDYEIVDQIRFDGMQHRRDIGHRAVGGGRK